MGSSVHLSMCVSLRAACFPLCHRQDHRPNVRCHMVDWRFRWWVGSFCLVVVGLFSAWSVEVEGSRLAQVDQDLSPVEYAVRLGSCLESRGAEWVLSGDGEAVMVLETPAQPQDVQQELIDGCRHDLIKQGLLPGPRAITPALLWGGFRQRLQCSGLLAGARASGS